MISLTAEYALRAMVSLAEQPEQRMTGRTLAARTGVPAGYLAKIMKRLGSAGLVRGQRGLGGGFALDRPPERISLLQVINAVDPLQRIEHCPLGKAAHGTRLCPLHRRIDEALAHVERAFERTTLADVLPEPITGPALCQCSTPESERGAVLRVQPDNRATSDGEPRQ